MTHYADCPYCHSKIWDVDEYGTGHTHIDCPECGEKISLFIQKKLDIQVGKVDKAEKDSEGDEK